jgi:predicted RNase H-like nuclease
MLSPGSTLMHSPRDATHAVGIDGCAAGWVACIVPVASATCSYASASCQLVTDLAAFIAEFPRAVIAIDMPIGLLDVPEPGGRACDRAARQRLPAGRTSSIFTPPTRSALRAGLDVLAQSGSRSHARAEASRVNQALAPAGVKAGIAAQSFGLFPKIAQVDALITPDLQRRLVETHPELAFLCLSAGAPLPSKKLAEGRAARMSLLQRIGVNHIESMLRATTRTGLLADDLLDAVVCAVTAHRVITGTAETLGSTQLDARGLRMTISV